MNFLDSQANFKHVSGLLHGSRCVCIYLHIKGVADKMQG